MDDSKPPRGTVGERIRVLLAERQMSQRQLAAAIAGDGAASTSVENVRRQISSWVNDEHAPSPENAAKLAEHLSVSVEWLTDDTTGRRSLSAALEELADLIDTLSRRAEAEATRSEDAGRIVQGLDQRLAGIEALLGQLLEGQVTASGALGELLDRWNEGGATRRDPRRGGKPS